MTWNVWTIKTVLVISPWQPLKENSNVPSCLYFIHAKELHRCFIINVYMEVGLNNGETYQRNASFNKNST